MVTLLTWIIPSGKYNTLSYDKTTHTFIQNKVDGSLSLPATQATLLDLQIKIPLQKLIKVKV